MSTTHSNNLTESIQKSIMEIEKCQQPFAWILPSAQMLLWVSCSFYPENATTFTFWQVWKVFFTFWTLGKVLQEFGGLSYSDRMRLIFGTTCMIPWFLVHDSHHSCYHCSTVATIVETTLTSKLWTYFHSVPFSFIPKPYSLQATFDTTCTPHFKHRVPWFCLQPPRKGFFLQHA